MDQVGVFKHKVLLGFYFTFWIWSTHWMYLGLWFETQILGQLEFFRVEVSLGLRCNLFLGFGLMFAFMFKVKVSLVIYFFCKKILDLGFWCVLAGVGKALIWELEFQFPTHGVMHALGVVYI